MLIEASRRAEAAAREMLALINAGGVVCDELREMLHISKATTAVLTAAQTRAASIIAKSERHGDGGTGVLTETAGLSRRDAFGQINTAEAISQTPSVRDAVESGRVSQANARRLAEAVKRTSAEAVESDAGLLAKAQSLTAKQFAKEARRWTADHQRDGGERDHQRLRARRKLRIWNADDGTVQLHGVFDPVTGKRIESRLRAEALRMYNADKKLAAGRGAGGSGDLPGAGRRTHEQCMADTFDNLTSPAADQPTDPDTSAAPPAGVGRSFADISVIAHVDNTTGELIAELPDGARLPAAVLEELACNARLTGLVYGTAGTPIWRTKSARTATEGQRQALLNRWGGCFHCAARPDMCQIHHIVPVSRGGATKIDNMVPVCWDCHNKIHHHHWQIRKRPGGQHTLHPPNSTHHGPAQPPLKANPQAHGNPKAHPGSAHAPEQSPLFASSDPPEPEPALQRAGAGRPRGRDPAHSSGR